MQVDHSNTHLGALATSYKAYTTAAAAANRFLVAQCKGLFQHPVQLQGGWPEDDTDCPPLSTAAMSQTPHSESGTERRMMAGMTSQDACNTQHTIREYLYMVEYSGHNTYQQLIITE